MKKINLDLSVGQPTFLQTYWDNKKLQQLNIKTSYPKPEDSELNELICRLHKLEKNCIFDKKFIIYGNGATQLIGAIVKALNNNVRVKPPYYYRFKNIVETRGLKFSKKGLIGTRIVTIPNNPDNSSLDYPLHFGPIIYDLNYNWSIYKTPRKMNKSIMVFSASKGLGLASIRFAWAFIEDDVLYEKVKEILYHETVHVSQLTIDAMKQILKHEIRNYKKNGVFKVGQTILNNRWQKILSMKLPFILLNNSGMFIYAEGVIPKNIQVMSGSLLGENNQRFRINLGCSESEFQTLIRLLKHE